MNTQQLQYFMITAHLQNISKAAEHLHISQSALSKQIGKLESEIGYSLFDRNGKKIYLNNAGKRFLLSGNRILQELTAANNDIALLLSAEDKRIRIGAAYLSQAFINCMAAFAKDFPDTEFILNNRIEYEEHININDFDALICPEDLKYENLSGYPFSTEKYHLAVPSSGPFGKEKVFTEEMLKQMTLVFIQSNGIFPELPYRVLSSVGTEIGHRFFTDTRESHYRLVSAGLACGFVPDNEAEIYKNDRNITLLHIMDARFSRKIKICFLREKHLSPHAAAFRQFAVEYLNLK